MAGRAMLKGLRERMPLRRQLFGALRATGRVPQRVWTHLPYHGVFTGRVGTRRFRMNAFGASVENSIYWAGVGGEFEPTSLLAWALLARASDVIWDVGANSGLFAVIAAAVNPRARVVAFEPLPRVAEKAAINARLNAHPFTVETLGLSDSEGEVDFFETTAAHVYSASIATDRMLKGHEVVTSRLSVTTADAYVERSGGAVPTLLKIDVERHEPAVIAGFRRHLNRVNPPHLVIEILDADVAAAVSAELAGAAYRMFRIDEGVGLEEVTAMAVFDGRNYLLLGPAAPALFAGPRITHAALKEAVDAL